MAEQKTLIFDFDGTIADSMDLVIDIANWLSKRSGFKFINKEDKSTLQKLSMREILRNMGVPFYKIPSLILQIQAEMGRQIKQLKPFSGIPEAIKELKNLQFKLVIITSNSKNNVKSFLINNDLDIFDYVDSTGIYGLLGKNFKINSFLSVHALNKNSCIYIGDEIRDIEAARLCNLKIAVVQWGYNSPEVLIAHKPDFLVSDPSNLVAILKDIFP